MIEVTNIHVDGFEAAIRGMRNPLNSWSRSDSYWTHMEDDHLVEAPFEFFIGENDMNLMKKLFNAGSEHRKFLRMIHVSMDVNAPLYWWKEADTYKVATVANSCSTMHKIADHDFTQKDFSIEHLTNDSLFAMRRCIWSLNQARQSYILTKSKDDWWNMIQLLPASYNQKRTWDINYETVFNIIHQRENHKLDEWNQLVDILKELPYVGELLNE